ncbi:MAG: helix-turn-helix transcriptional regulator [Alphaproteobacteria bacterium]
MRRADRLFEIVQQLRGARLVTANGLAEKLEVSVRTIYRDVRDLQSAGVPIDGAAGVGYLLRPGYQLPPLMFSSVEIEALIVGARMVRSWAGHRLADSAAEALVKIGEVVPAERMRAAERVPVFSNNVRPDERERDNLDLFGRAIDGRQKISFTYCDSLGEDTERTVWPLAMHFWGKVWTLAAWCELRDDFRTFRVDRAADLALTGAKYERRPGRTLEDYLGKMTLSP